MGLDSYLREHTSITPDYGLPIEQWDDRAKAIADNIGIEHLKGKVIKSIVTEAAYWRKANQIHNWFVQNVQDGLDECQSAWVSPDQLKELHDLCVKLTDMLEKDERKAKETAMTLLPPSQGFFFGSDEIGEWYWEDLQNTITQLEPVLENIEMDGKEKGCYTDYYYQSSW